MNLDHLKQDWEALNDEGAFVLPHEPSIRVQKFYRSMTYRKLFINNLIELLLDIMNQLMAGLVFLYLAQTNDNLPWHYTLFVWLLIVVALIPTLVLYRSINYPSPVGTTKTYISGLIRKLKWYRNFNLTLNFLAGLLIVIPGLLLSKGWMLTVNGETYIGVINYPAPYFRGAFLVILVIAILTALLFMLFSYLWFWVFYNERLKDLKLVLERLDEED